MVINNVYAKGCAETYDFTEQVVGNEWELIKIVFTVSSEVPQQKEFDIDRGNLIIEGNEKYYTIKFLNETVSGIASPSEYVGKYQLAEERWTSLTTSEIENSNDDCLLAVGKLNEKIYLEFIQNINGWNMWGKDLRLFSKDHNGKSIYMDFKKK
jgi:hypothetical protein